VCHQTFRNQFRPIFAHSASTVRGGENSSISTNTKLTTRFPWATDEPCALPLSSPKGGTKRDFAVFASKIQLLSKEVCYNVSLCENFQRQSCSYIIFLFTVHRGIVGDVHIYLKFADKVTDPFRKRWFRQISLSGASAVRASEKPIISSRKSTMRFQSSNRWTLCVTLGHQKRG